jgi:hypothetical protein
MVNWKKSPEIIENEYKKHKTVLNDAKIGKEMIPYLIELQLNTPLIQNGTEFKTVTNIYQEIKKLLKTPKKLNAFKNALELCKTHKHSIFPAFSKTEINGFIYIGSAPKDEILIRLHEINRKRYTHKLAIKYRKQIDERKKANLKPLKNNTRKRTHK